MSSDTLIDKINHLPSVLSKGLNDYLKLLNAHNVVEKIKVNLNKKRQLIDEKEVNIYDSGFSDKDKKPKLKREFGGLKGFVTYIADDFDEPLDDFKDYM